LASRRTIVISTTTGRYLALQASELRPDESPLAADKACQILERLLLRPSELAQLFSLGRAIGLGSPGSPGAVNARALRHAFGAGAWVLVPQAAHASQVEPRALESAAEQVKVAKELKTWVEMEVVDDDGRPMAGEAFTCMLPDGTIHQGSLDKNGRVRFDAIDPGNCAFSLPSLHGPDWRRA
jgi:hypothetical protein